MEAVRRVLEACGGTLKVLELGFLRYERGLYLANLLKEFQLRQLRRLVLMRHCIFYEKSACQSQIESLRRALPSCPTVICEGCHGVAGGRGQLQF